MSDDRICTEQGNVYSANRGTRVYTDNIKSNIDTVVCIDTNKECGNVEQYTHVDDNTILHSIERDIPQIDIMYYYEIDICYCFIVVNSIQKGVEESRYCTTYHDKIMIFIYFQHNASDKTLAHNSQ